VSIDAHVHLWDNDTRDHGWVSQVPGLGQKYVLDDYERQASNAGIVGAILVQVLNNEDETLEFLATASSSPVIRGVVGWLNLEDPNVGERLSLLRSSEHGRYLVGIRHLVEGEPDPHFLERPSVLKGLCAVAKEDLVFDLVVRPRQMASALRAIALCPELRVVLDHGGKPPIALELDYEWAKQISEYGLDERIACKISGLVNEAGTTWREESFAPIFDHLFSAFGPSRLLFGSDWPVCTTVSSLGDVVSWTKENLQSLSQSEQTDVMQGTAERVYLKT
jgi:L-fuconolactonase